MASQGYLSKRLLLGDKSYSGRGRDLASVKISAAEKALLQTEYKFTALPSVILSAPWMVSAGLSNSESWDDVEESVTDIQENATPARTSISRSPVRPQRPPSTGAYSSQEISSLLSFVTVTAVFVLSTSERIFCEKIVSSHVNAHFTKLKCQLSN